MENLAAMAGVRSEPRTLRAARASAELAAGRTCYDHLAGGLGVWLFDGMRTSGLVGTTDGLWLTADGTAWLDRLGVEREPPRRRPLLRTWTGPSAAPIWRARSVRRSTPGSWSRG